MQSTILMLMNSSGSNTKSILVLTYRKRYLMIHHMSFILITCITYRRFPIIMYSDYQVLIDKGQNIFWYIKRPLTLVED